MSVTTRSALILLLAGLAVCQQAAAHRVVRSAEEKEFLKTLYEAVRDIPNGIPAFERRKRDAQAQLASRGQRTNERLTDILLKSLNPDLPSGLDQNDLPLGLSPYKLLCLASYDRSQAARLSGPLEQWLESAVQGKIPQIQDSILFVQQAAAYINQWGDAHIKDRLKRLLNLKGDASDLELTGVPLAVVGALRLGPPRGSLPDDYETSLSDWCLRGSVSEHVLHNPVKAIPSNTSGRSVGDPIWNWVGGISVAIGILFGVICLVLRRRMRR